MYKKRSLFRIAFLVLGIALLVLFVIHRQFILEQGRLQYTTDNIEQAPVGLVFGAGLRKSGQVSDVLRDRLIAGAELYKAGKVQKLLFSGDNGQHNYDEVSAMKAYATEFLAIPAEDIVLDYAGFDTYDSCYRAQAIFGVTNTIAVSQEFHLPRVVYLCEQRGIQTQAYVADKQQYRDAERNQLREYLAQVKAWLEVQLHTKPKFLGKKEYIFVE